MNSVQRKSKKSNMSVIPSGDRQRRQIATEHGKDILALEYGVKVHPDGSATITRPAAKVIADPKHRPAYFISADGACECPSTVSYCIHRRALDLHRGAAPDMSFGDLYVYLMRQAGPGVDLFHQITGVTETVAEWVENMKWHRPGRGERYSVRGDLVYLVDDQPTMRLVYVVRRALG